jgi:hypothetical protein
MTPDCDPKDLPKSCPFLPFFRDREGNEFPRDCIGERCQWWWKCREPDDEEMEDVTSRSMEFFSGSPVNASIKCPVCGEDISEMFQGWMK